MNPKRILLILAVALSLGLADATVVRPLNPAAFKKKEKPAPKAVVTPKPDGATVDPGVTPVVVEQPADDMTAAELNELVQSAEAVILDARLPEEFAAGRIPFSLNISFQSFAAGKPKELDAYPTSHPFVIYCGGGDCDASEKVQIMMESLGFTDIRIYHAGWPGWLEFGGEIETGAPQ